MKKKGKAESVWYLRLGIGNRSVDVSALLKHNNSRQYNSQWSSQKPFLFPNPNPPPLNFILLNWNKKQNPKLIMLEERNTYLGENANHPFPFVLFSCDRFIETMLLSFQLRCLNPQQRPRSCFGKRLCSSTTSYSTLASPVLGLFVGLPKPPRAHIMQLK